MTNDAYVHGHHESVLRSHRWRTAENSAAFLLPVLEPGMTLLDVGCGPGTVTIDLASRVGRAVGLDRSPTVLASAREAAKDVPNVDFVEGDAYALPFEDDSFDVVYAHQVLQHLTDPIAALREMRRVARPGGYVAVRDADYSAMTWYPRVPGLEDWIALYHEVAEANHNDADAGRKLLSWVLQAGFDLEDVTPGAGVWCYASPEDRRWWGELWADRCLRSNFAKQALGHRLADDVHLEQLAEAWHEWAAVEDGWFAILHGEVLARV